MQGLSFRQEREPVSESIATPTRPNGHPGHTHSSCPAGHVNTSKIDRPQLLELENKQPVCPLSARHDSCLASTRRVSFTANFSHRYRCRARLLGSARTGEVIPEFSYRVNTVRERADIKSIDARALCASPVERPDFRVPGFQDGPLLLLIIICRWLNWAAPVTRYNSHCTLAWLRGCF